MNKKNICFLMILLLLFLFPKKLIYAESNNIDPEQQELYLIESEILDNLQLDSFNQYHMNVINAKDITFKELLRAVLKGDFKEIFRGLKSKMNDIFWDEIINFRKGYLYTILLSLLAALFTNISSIFRDKKTAGTGFFLIYVSMSIVILQIFRDCSGQVEYSMNELSEFMKLLSSSFAICIGISNGVNSAAGIYMILLIVVWFVELMFIKILIPMSHFYIVLVIVNHMSEDSFLEQFCYLIKGGVNWIIKTVIGIVTGLNLVQGLISPATDSLKKTLIWKTTEAIPGVGDALAGSGEVLTGTASLIRNAIGVTGMIFCILICIIPIVRFFCYMVLYRLAAGILEPITDKRISNTLSDIGSGFGILLYLIFGSALLFLISITIVLVLLK